MKEASEKIKDLSSYEINPDQEIKIWEAVGCEKCNEAGYKGRIGVFEAILSDEAIENIVNKNPSDREIKKGGPVSRASYYERRWYYQ